MILAGMFCGLCSACSTAAMIAFLRIPPIVMTLGTLAVFRGMIIIIARGDQVNASEMGARFQAFPKQVLLGLTTPVWIAIVVSILFWIFLNATRSGRGLYAVGGNPIAARYCGIDRESRKYSSIRFREPWRACAAICGWRDTASPIPRSPAATN